MLTVRVDQDLAEYKPKVYMGLTMRTIACIGAGLASSVAIAVFLTFVVGVPSTMALVFFWVPAIPATLVGFITPHGMRFEEWLPLYVRHASGAHRICYESPHAAAGMKEPAGGRGDRKESRYARKRWRAFAKLAGRKGYELWSPGGELSLPGQDDVVDRP